MFLRFLLVLLLSLQPLPTHSGKTSMKLVDVVRSNAAANANSNSRLSSGGRSPLASYPVQHPTVEKSPYAGPPLLRQLVGQCTSYVSTRWGGGFVDALRHTFATSNISNSRLNPQLRLPGLPL